MLCRQLPFYGALLATALTLGYLAFALDADTLSADFSSFAMTIPAARMLELFKARAECVLRVLFFSSIGGAGSVFPPSGGGAGVAPASRRRWSGFIPSPPPSRARARRLTGVGGC